LIGNELIIAQLFHVLTERKDFAFPDFLLYLHSSMEYNNLL